MKKWIWIALGLVIAGVLLGSAAFAKLNFDIYKLEGLEMNTNSYEFSETVTAIQIDTVSDVRVEAVDAGPCRVVCTEAEGEIHEVTVDGGTLHILRVDTRKWYQHIRLFNFRQPKVTVYLPKGAYTSLSVHLTAGDLHIAQQLRFDSLSFTGTAGDLTCLADVTDLAKIHVTTGDIELIGMEAGQLDLKLTTGDVEMEDVTCTGDVLLAQTTGDLEFTRVSCNNLSAEATTGDMELEDVIAAATFRLKNGTGDVHLDRCDGAELSLETTTGSVTGTLLSEKIFIAKTSTGSVRVPESTTGGNCEIKTSTGNIRMEIVR